jgi:curved DNA-binding protein CbpA
MPVKEPHLVLGIEPGASPDEIKAAWRALARRHHPDLTGDDPESAQRATRRMAEINAAYAALTRAGETQEAHTRAASRAANGSAGTAAGAMGRRSGPPPPPKTRPVTGRLDLSDNVHPRNQTTTPPGSRVPLSGQPPLRWDRSSPDLRASQPSGPMEIRRDPRFVPPTAPPLGDALIREVEFGKFHGHTLGEIAAFEPSYIDWLAGTLTRDPELALAARVIRDELDRRGIIRTTRPSRPGWQSNPFR